MSKLHRLDFIRGINNNAAILYGALVEYKAKVGYNQTE